VCGKCESRLNSRTVAGEPRRWRYACIRLPGRQATHCGGISISGEPLDELVTDLVLDLLSEPGISREAPRVPDGKPEAMRKAAVIQSRLQELLVNYTSGRIARADYLIAQERGKKALAELHLETFGTPVNPLAGFPTTEADVRQVWEGLNLDRQRAVLRVLIKTVLVRPAVSHAPRFDPNRVEIGWRA